MIDPKPSSKSVGFSLVEASISDLQLALSFGGLTAVELVHKYLRRIAAFDADGPCLNSVCVLNPYVFEEAQASDTYRASGKPPRPLEGIPFTVKDSYQVKGMAVSNGSPAFADLIASSDAAVVELLRNAGAIMLGRTNMPPMADGGAQRGLYGRAESPYSAEYLTTAFASGSSNGAGTSTAASFAAFGLGAETVSSGRAPASCNALVGYAPSRGMLSPRGAWPLYPTCDVVVPMTRTTQDLLQVLNVLVKDDYRHEGDLWREQTTVHIPKAAEVRPRDFAELQDPSALVGKKIGVPRCFLGQADGELQPCFISDSVRALWNQAKTDLEALGAVVVETEFPLLKRYCEQTYPGQSSNVPGIGKRWKEIERLEMIAVAWDDFLRYNGDETCSELAMSDADRLFPFVTPMDDPKMYTEKENHIQYWAMMDSVRGRPRSMLDLPGCDQALKALEVERKIAFEDWLQSEGFDFLAFPTLGDVCPADAEENPAAMLHALQEGVKYANGGRALRHLGIPSITVPMGSGAQNKMPAGVTFIGKAYADADLLRYAYAYEHATKRRSPPSLTPALDSDLVCLRARHNITSDTGVSVKISTKSYTCTAEEGCHVYKVCLSGSAHCESDHHEIESLSIAIDNQPEKLLHIQDGRWHWEGEVRRQVPVAGFSSWRKSSKDHVMIVLLAKASQGQAGGVLAMID